MQLDLSSAGNTFIAVITAMTPIWIYIFKSMRDSRRREDLIMENSGKREDVLVKALNKNTKSSAILSMLVYELVDIERKKNGKKPANLDKRISTCDKMEETFKELLEDEDEKSD